MSCRRTNNSLLVIDCERKCSERLNTRKVLSNLPTHVHQFHHYFSLHVACQCPNLMQFGIRRGSY